MVARSCLLLIGRLKDGLEVVVLITGGLRQQGMPFNSKVVIFVAIVAKIDITTPLLYNAENAKYWLVSCSGFTLLFFVKLFFIATFCCSELPCVPKAVKKLGDAFLNVCTFSVYLYYFSAIRSPYRTFFITF